MASVIQESTVAQLHTQYQKVRSFTGQIISTLSAEDCMVQSMDDVSPTRWHIAHTTWFFETFILKTDPQYKEFDPQFNFLFNSYYNSIGKQFPRPQRGFISRPGLADIKQYRDYVDQQISGMFTRGKINQELLSVVQVGLHHEQQHQELMLTDIKHVLSCNPTLPKYNNAAIANVDSPSEDWIEIPAGMYEIGHQDSQAFCFDNELPTHCVYLNDCHVSRDLVTCGQFIEFIEAGGYQNPQHWLSMGWATVGNEGWDAPLYWTQIDGTWHMYTLSGLVPINRNWPVCHVSYFEADAFARWSGHRLPTEFEWEAAARKTGTDQIAGGQFADKLFSSGNAIHPTQSSSSLFGGTWQWTSSSYAAYPGYQPPAGAIGEYNGKFMCNQYVLRGGSVATSSDHIRATYRNFFPPVSRWQFFGLRLAK